MSSTRDEKKHHHHGHHPIATFVGASAAGAMETIAFYPPEALSRRLQVNKTKLYTPGTGTGLFFLNLKTAIFGSAGKIGFVRGMLDLYSGVGIGIVYKIAQRGYKIGGQKIIEQEMDQYCGPAFNGWFGQRMARLMLAGTSGMVVGMFEAPLLIWLDAIKVRYQTNKDSVSGKGILSILNEERARLYNGIGWTMARNAVGSWTLFGTKTYMEEYICRPRQTNSDASLSIPERIFSASTAAIASVLSSSPMDVVKTRIQSGKENGKSGFKIATDMVCHEGVSSFFKGAVAKSAATVPRLTFALVAADGLAKWITRKIKSKDNPPSPPVPEDLKQFIEADKELESVKLR